MVQTKIENKANAGTCKACERKSDFLFTPPLISPPDWHAVGVIGDDARWSPGGVEQKYNLAFHDKVMYLRPQEIPHDPICWRCFVSCLVAEEFPFVVNAPGQYPFLVMDETAPMEWK